jgi:hypothetical protein
MNQLKSRDFVTTFRCHNVLEKTMGNKLDGDPKLIKDIKCKHLNYFLIHYTTFAQNSRMQPAYNLNCIV